MESIGVDVPDAHGGRPVRLSVRRWSGDLTPFVLVHGLSSNARLWDEVAAVLASAGHQVCAVDLRSHGESDAPPGGYDTTTAADDVVAVGAALGLSRPVLVGQSWGGNVVVRLAGRHPELAAGLALVDGGWIDLPTQFDTWERCERALRPPVIDGVRAVDLRLHFRTAHPDWSDVAIEATLANLREEADGTVTRRLSIPHHLAIVRSMWDEPPWRDFPHITAPVLMMPALPATDGEAKRALVGKAAAAVARATVKEYVGADHDLHAQQPARVAADLLALAAEV